MTEPQPITADEFDKFASGLHKTSGLLDECEWWRFASRAGVVIFDRSDKDWSWVALAKNPKNRAQAYAFGSSLSEIDTARRRLFVAMNAELADGWWK